MEEGMGGNGSKKVVCVTGCNGYVAAELVKQLLQRGACINECRRVR